MKTAMILAAGRGERLKPLTELIPKAMCLIKGKPLIEYHIEHLKETGFQKIVINHAYLGGYIRHYLGNGSRWGINIVYSPEPPGGLETGGGIVKALSTIGNNPFLVVNADIYTDFDFSTIDLYGIEFLHTVLVNKNPNLDHHGDFNVLEKNLLTNKDPHYTFAGIAGYHPRVFESCTIGRYSVIPLIRELADKNKVTAEVYQGVWYDIGTLSRLAEVNDL